MVIFLLTFMNLIINFYDLERDSKLLEKGIYVFRIKNKEVSDPENTIKIINTIIDQRIKVLG